jgi:hypothetical protein
MPRKKTAAKLADEKEREQASAIAAILIETCSLLDDVLTRGEPAMMLHRMVPVIARMEAYLDRRGHEGRDPVWVARMRRTVTRFKLRLKLSRPAASLELH